jgi:hypothetical protein
MPVAVNADLPAQWISVAVALETKQAPAIRTAGIDRWGTVSAGLHRPATTPFSHRHAFFC